jgi:multidrug resistance protein MdtO
MLFVTRIALWKYHMRLPGFELPDDVRLAQREFDKELAKTLDGMAERFEGKPGTGMRPELEDCFKRLEKRVQASSLSVAQSERFLALSRRVEQLAASLNGEI